MKTCIIYLGMAALGYLIAVPFRKYKENFKKTGNILTVVVLTLVFAMGYRIGSNTMILSQLGMIGIYSLLFSTVPLAASVFALCFVRKLMGFNHQGIYVKGKEKAKTNICQDDKVIGIDESTQNVKKKVISASTIRIAVSVILGIIIGYMTVIKLNLFDYEMSYHIGGVYITYALYTMVFLVGIDMGLDGSAIHRFRSAGVRILIFPLTTGIVTVLTVLICGLFTPLSLKDLLGISCTFCWYSLGPNIIMDAGMVTTGAIAFLSNFLRVIFSLFIIPFVAEKIGYIETTGMPIAASMDVCIATIENATNKSTAICAFISGCIFTALVPTLIPIIVAA